MLLDMATGGSTDNIVSLDQGTVVKTVAIDPQEGQVPVLLEEFDAIADICAEDPRWVQALADRETVPEKVMCIPL